MLENGVAMLGDKPSSKFEEHVLNKKEEARLLNLAPRHHAKPAPIPLCRDPLSSPACGFDIRLLARRSRSRGVRAAGCRALKKKRNENTHFEGVWQAEKRPHSPSSRKLFKYTAQLVLQF